MDLGNQHSPIGRYDGRSSAELLTEIRAGVRGRRALVIDEWVGIVAWADQNVIATVEGAATLVEGVIDTGVPIAGPGAPLVSEFALMELIAVLERSPDGGRSYVGQVVECAWRLPRLYAAVVAGKVEHWKAQRVADLTRSLPAEAAEFVDRHLNAAIGGVGWAQLERLVTEAILRFDPERAEKERQAANDRRHLGPGEVDQHGQVAWDGLLDADSHDLDQALTREATLRGKLGDESSLDVRRSKAAGAIARRDLALDLLIADEETGEVIAEVPGRRVELHVHITDDEDNSVGRCEETRSPITVAQIKEWLRAPNTTAIVRPVINIGDCIPVDSYEIPDRHRRRVQLRDHSCRFPGCPKPAARCDLDHHVPHAEGGPTCPCQLVPLCRRHHRAKTFSLWRYVIIAPAHYLWISPNGRHFHVGPEGTRALDPPRRPDPDEP